MLVTSRKVSHTYVNEAVDHQLAPKSG